MSKIAATGLDPNTLRQLNEGVVLRALNATTGPITVAELSAQTALSRRPIEEILAALIERGWVTSAEPTATTERLGRPARQFSFQADRVLIAAINIDMRTVTAVVTDVHGTTLGSAERELADYFDPVSCVQDASRALDDALAGAHRPLADIAAAAIASGGVIDRAGTVRHLVNAPRWDDYPLADAMSEATGIPFLADNNANLAALGEHWRGAARDELDFVWTILGDRVGMGIIVGANIYPGVDGAAGELVEAAVFNFDALKRQPISWLTSPVDAQREAALDLVARARAGDQDSLAAIDDYVAMVFPAVVTMAWIIAPPLLILGGGIEAAGDLVVPRMQKRLQDAGLPNIEVRASSLGWSAVLLGGARAVLDRFDVELFGPSVTS